MLEFRRSHQAGPKSARETRGLSSAPSTPSGFWLSHLPPPAGCPESKPIPNPRSISNRSSASEVEFAIWVWERVWDWAWISGKHDSAPHHNDISPARRYIHRMRVQLTRVLAVGGVCWSCAGAGQQARNHATAAVDTESKPAQPKAETHNSAIAKTDANKETADASVDDEPRMPDVPHCQDESEITVTEGHPDGLIVTRRTLSGSKSVRLATGKVEAKVAVSPDEQLVAGVQGLLTVKTRKWQPMPACENWVSPQFVPGGTQLVAEIWNEAKKSPNGFVLVDYQQARIVTRLDGRAPAVTSDGGVLFLRNGGRRKAGAGSQPPTGYVGIYKYRHGQTKELKRVELNPDYLYDVTEVVSLEDGKFLYRVYDEHEYRYYDQDDKPFFPGSDGHYRSPESNSHHMGASKEQYHLRISGDGRLAVFAERNWNELTYLVAIDLVSRIRRELPVVGSFPTTLGRRIVFSSDPSFVAANESARKFRQIADWALYAYDLDTNSLCLIDKYTYPTVVQ